MLLTNSHKSIAFEYDYQGRRIARKVWNNTAGTNDPIVNLKYLYDGWNLIAELDGNNALVRAYTWGLDASGSMQGAGGVGGLLMVNAGSGGVHFPAYDLNGNVMGLVSGSNGTLAAKYEYGPFGEVFCSVGDMAKVNPFGFSTKYTDSETDLVYYGYRYYSPALGRWMSRDPIEERGGLNLYGFVNNDPVNAYDILGLWKIERKAESRAMAYAEDGDTIKRLARIIRLNPEEYRMWLKPEIIYTKPYNEDTKLTKCDSFSIPNTAYIDVSAYTLSYMGIGLNHYRSILKTHWQKQGYKVDYSYYTVTKDLVIAHLNDPDLYAYAYIGHGGAGYLIPSKATWLLEFIDNAKERFYEKRHPDVSPDILENWVKADKYTPFGISDMRLIACYSNLGADDWKKNVSRYGLLFTIEGEFSLRGGQIKDEAGD